MLITATRPSVKSISAAINMDRLKGKPFFPTHSEWKMTYRILDKTRLATISTAPALMERIEQGKGEGGVVKV